MVQQFLEIQSGTSVPERSSASDIWDFNAHLSAPFWIPL